MTSDWGCLSCEELLCVPRAGRFPDEPDVLLGVNDGLQPKAQEMISTEERHCNRSMASFEVAHRSGLWGLE